MWLQQQEDSIYKPNSQIFSVRTEVKASSLSSKILGANTFILSDIPNHERLIIADGSQYTKQWIQTTNDLFLFMTYLQRTVSWEDWLKLDDIPLLKITLILHLWYFIHFLFFWQILVLIDIFNRDMITIEINQYFQHVTTSYSTENFDCCLTGFTLSVAWEDV